MTWEPLTLPNPVRGRPGADGYAYAGMVAIGSWAWGAPHRPQKGAPGGTGAPQFPQ
jgi:hypothetical protein